ncbi:MAG TPA: glycosyltransferase family 4 protein [Kiloniellales bacterium]|nr:glycosyltransferase family 4 protein [Kiloniellales bacterium]
MRIAQVSPLIESVPPKLYGGTERVISWLTEELIRQGHEVTLFASGDSQTAAELVAGSQAALRFDENVVDPLPHYFAMLEEVRRRASDFDVIHFHVDYLHFPQFSDIATRTLTTQHGRLDLPDLVPVFEAFPQMPQVSISDHQRQPMPSAHWLATVYHGLPLGLHPYDPTAKRDYLAFLGRICPEKRPDRAIEIARRADMPLKIAAKVDKADRDYFKAKIEPLLDDPLVEFIGEINETEKTTFLSGAKALLFPIDWPEPFGLVMIEAMAYGTPVIAWPCGSVPEIIEDGLTGLHVNSIDEAVAALDRLDNLNPAAIRSRFEERFSVERMAADYVNLYRQLIGLESLAGKAVAAE